MTTTINWIKGVFMSNFHQNYELRNDVVIHPEKIKRSVRAGQITFGDTEIKSLANFINVNPDRAVEQWHRLKIALQQLDDHFFGQTKMNMINRRLSSIMTA